MDVLAIAPSERIEMIAARHLRRLPPTVRALLGAIGGARPASASFASYLLFEAEFANELIALGHADAMRDRQRLAEWIASAGDPSVPPPGSPPALQAASQPAAQPALPPSGQSASPADARHVSGGGTLPASADSRRADD